MFGLSPNQLLDAQLITQRVYHSKKRVPNQIKRKKKMCEKINSYIATYVLSPRPRAVGTKGTYA